MSTLINLISGAVDILLSFFDLISFLFDRLLQSVTLTLDIVGKVDDIFLWMPAVPLGILGSIFAIIVVEKILAIIT